MDADHTAVDSGHTHASGTSGCITGVVFTANGKPLAWRRDDVNLYEFHLTVPEGVTTLHAHLDCIVTSRVSQKLAVLEWEKLLLYPARYAGEGHSDSAVAEGAGRMGHRHSADAGERGTVSGAGGGKHDGVCGDECGAA